MSEALQVLCPVSVLSAESPEELGIAHERKISAACNKPLTYEETFYVSCEEAKDDEVSGSKKIKVFQDNIKRVSSSETIRV